MFIVSRHLFRFCIIALLDKGIGLWTGLEDSCEATKFLFFRKSNSRKEPISGFFCFPIAPSSALVEDDEETPRPSLPLTIIVRLRILILTIDNVSLFFSLDHFLFFIILHIFFFSSSSVGRHVTLAVVAVVNV